MMLFEWNSYFLYLALVLRPPPPPPPPVVNQVEEPVQTIESQSSQLTNDQSDTQPVISSTTTITTADKLNTTPSRISYRRNPDGSLVSISRPRLSANPQTPTSVLRRVKYNLSIVFFLLFSFRNLQM